MLDTTLPDGISGTFPFPIASLPFLDLPVFPVQYYHFILVNFIITNEPKVEFRV